MELMLTAVMAAFIVWAWTNSDFRKNALSKGGKRILITLPFIVLVTLVVQSTLNLSSIRLSEENFSFLGIGLKDLLISIDFPLANALIYNLLLTRFRKILRLKSNCIFASCLVSVLLVFSILNYHHLYTFIVSLFLVLILAVFGIVYRLKCLRGFYILYPLMLLPLFTIMTLLPLAFGYSEGNYKYTDDLSGLNIVNIPIEEIFTCFALTLIQFIAAEKIRKKSVSSSQELTDIRAFKYS